EGFARPCQGTGAGLSSPHSVQSRNPCEDRFMSAKSRTYTIREAAERLGFRRPNTFREKYLNSPEARAALGAAYDHQGRLVLDRKAVDQLANEVEEERKRRGNWRARNLGAYARSRAKALNAPRPTHAGH